MPIWSGLIGTPNNMKENNETLIGNIGIKTTLGPLDAILNNTEAKFERTFIMKDTT